jgi:anaerobic ribonucleoside-triphosphate reductase activating protein
MQQLTARIASTACPTEAEGPGLRWAIWFQGCSIRCPGCCNPHFFTPDGGSEVTVQKLVDDIANAKYKYGIEGITLLGGEPTEQPEPAAELSIAARNMGLTVLMFTGRYLEDIETDHSINHLLKNIDLLVDGPYDVNRKETSRRFIGSSNQRLHILSNRVPQNDSRWVGSNTLEIRLIGGQVHVNGYPINGHRFPLA